MTEEDWANQVEPLAKSMFWESPYNYYEYRLAVNAWADWCEEGNGDYGDGLRLLSIGSDDGRPYRPWRSLSPNDKDVWRWLQLIGKAEEQQALAMLPDDVLFLMLSDPDDLYRAPSLLRAMKDAARAFQEARKKTAA
jgi:hypothetical protein